MHTSKTRITFAALRTLSLSLGCVRLLKERSGYICSVTCPTPLRASDHHFPHHLTSSKYVVSSHVFERCQPRKKRLTLGFKPTKYAQTNHRLVICHSDRCTESLTGSSRPMPPGIKVVKLLLFTLIKHTTNKTVYASTLL